MTGVLRTVASRAPDRHCESCGSVARCVRELHESYEHMQTGIDYDYVCTHCGKAFTVEGWARLVMISVIASVSFSGGIAMLAGWLAPPRGPEWTVWLVVAIGGLATVQAVLKARLRWRCRVVKG